MLDKFHHFQHLAELYHGYQTIHRYTVRWSGDWGMAPLGLTCSARASGEQCLWSCDELPRTLFSLGREGLLPPPPLFWHEANLGAQDYSPGLG